MLQEFKIKQSGEPRQAVSQAWSVNVYRLVLVALVGAGLALATVPLFAQVNTATLQGTITDPSGAAIAGAEVTLTNSDTATVRTTTTGETGNYFIPSIQPGHYEVSVSKSGFSRAKDSSVTLEVGQVATVNLALKLGNVSETVEVSTAEVRIQTEDSTLGSVLPRQQIVDLPLNGRQFSQLLSLQPGTVPIDNSQNAGKAPNFGTGAASPGVDGQTNRSNTFFLDGILVTNPFFGGFSFSPSIDDIQEFKVQSHTDQAEFGQSTGAIVSVVSLPGTNSYHGALFEFVRNDIFDAQNRFSPKKLPFHQNQFGASFGGPIIKNKLFFFANYEGGRLVQPTPNFYTVPTADERNGDFSGLGPDGVTPLPTIYDPATYDPVTGTESPFAGNKIPSGRLDTQMQAFLNGVYPMPNFTPTTDNHHNYLATTGRHTTADQGSVRVDYNLGSKDVINGRYSQLASRESSASSLANIFTTGFDGKNTGGNWLHTYNSTLISQITVAYNALNIPQQIEMPVDQAALFAAAGLGAGFNEKPGDTTVTLVPGFGLQGGSYDGFWNGAGPIGPMHIFQLSGSVSKIHGNHNLKFGGSYYKTWMYTNWNGNNMDFSNKATWNAACQFGDDVNCPGGLATAGGDPAASMLLSLPIDATRNLGNSGVNLRQNTTGLFAQDSWKVTPRLTVNLGLRWDFAQPTTEDNGRLAFYNIYDKQYQIVHGDKDLPSGTLPPNVAVLSRRSITSPDYTNFSPRIGIAYQITSKTVLRLGAGRTFDDWGLPLQVAQNNRGAWPSGLAQNASTSPLNTAGISLKPDDTVVTGQNPFYGDAVLPPTPLPAGGLGFQDPKWKPSDSTQWNVEVQQNLGGLGVLSVAYVGSQTAHRTINYPYNTVTASTTPYNSNRAPDQIFVGVGTDLASWGTAKYQSFQTKLTRSFSSGFTYNAAFTWSRDRALSNCGEQFNQCIQNPADIAADYGPSTLNIPLIFTFNGTYELPFGKGRRYVNNGAGAWILGNWQVNSIVAARSGTVFNLSTNKGDIANIGLGGTERPNVNGDPNSGAPHKIGDWFNANVFSFPDSGTFGNSGINSLRGPSFWNVDFSLFRDIPFTERFKLQFRMEAFNLFNHQNFGNPGGQFGSGSFNTISSISGNERQIQFGLKLLF